MSTTRFPGLYCQDEEWRGVFGGDGIVRLLCLFAEFDDARRKNIYSKIRERSGLGFQKTNI